MLLLSVRRLAWCLVLLPRPARGFVVGGHALTRVRRLNAAPRSKLPERRVDIECAKCRTPLFRYAKANGAGSQLVKVYHERIVEDKTNGVFTMCPKCGMCFARETMIHGKRAFKIIGGKVRMR
mmetsp:Transcript_12442/g.37551  ORF Transcript_12442/g.37551 Transcript_12442/m.37551 type:complete len:123 (+) Transcript_12442:47-415(+)